MYKPAADIFNQSESLMSSGQSVNKTQFSGLFSTSTNLKIPKFSNQSPERLLVDFRTANAIVRKNKTSDLRHRYNHAPRYGFEQNSLTLPKNYHQRAPLLENKLKSVEFCEKIVR
jgi:hypothetical protein